MKSMMQFGEALVRYEGVAHFSLQECDTEFDLSGYFQAAQFASGRLAISAMPTDRPKPSKVAFQHSAEAELSFHARTVDGWTITLGGQKIFSYLMWTLAPFATQPTALDLSAQFMEAKRDGGTQDGYTNVQFVVSNLLWHGPSVKQPEPIELSSQSFEVKVIPVDSYVEVARRLISTHGIEPTALVRIRTHQCHAMPLQSFREFMEELVCVFRLATGNLVDWYYAEAVNHRTKEPVERLHKYAMTGPYSNTIIFRPLRKGYRSAIPKLDLPKLATAFLDDCHQGLEKAILKPLINQFTNACDDTSFLESRGLLASTLTELIAAKTAHKNGESDVIPQGEFNSKVYPALEEAIASTSLEGHIQAHVKQHLRGAYRSTFRRRLQRLDAFCRLGLLDSQIDRIVRIRNALVHEGTYGRDSESWIDDYRLITWANLIALCRLSGYRGELPPLRVGQHLEV